MNKNINTLKLILALMVIYCHAEIFPEIGHFAVCMFFMLSGYLIKSKIERQNRRYCFSDVKKQFFRIAPAYYLMLVVFVFLQFAIWKKIDYCSLIAHVCLIQSWFSHSAEHPYNGPTWYLSSYFAILLILVLILSVYRTERKQQRISLMITVGGVLLWLALYRFIVNQHWWVYYFPIAHLCEFGCGFFICEKQNEWKSIFFRNANMFLVLGLILFIVTIIYSQYINSIIIKENLVFLPASWLIVTWFIYTDEKKTCVSAWFHAKWVQILGRLSLQLFIYHMFVIRIFHYLGIDVFPWSAAIVIPSCLGFAVMMHKFYEPLFSRFISK